MSEPDFIFFLFLTKHSKFGDKRKLKYFDGENHVAAFTTLLKTARVNQNLLKVKMCQMGTFNTVTKNRLKQYKFNVKQQKWPKVCLRKLSEPQLHSC